MKRESGRQAEEIAVAYLANKGFEVETRNFRSRFGEIDIICRQDSLLIFVEVRSKTSNRFGEPEETMTEKKKAKIRKTAWEYLRSGKTGRHQGIRFDFIGVVRGPEGTRINHIEGAF